jgi:hypothetical protein
MGEIIIYFDHHHYYHYILFVKEMEEYRAGSSKRKFIKQIEWILPRKSNYSAMHNLSSRIWHTNNVMQVKDAEGERNRKFQC